LLHYGSTELKKLVSTLCWSCICSHNNHIHRYWICTKNKHAQQIMTLAMNGWEYDKDTDNGRGQNVHPINKRSHGHALQNKHILTFSDIYCIIAKIYCIIAQTLSFKYSLENVIQSDFTCWVIRGLASSRWTLSQLYKRVRYHILTQTLKTLGLWILSFIKCSIFTFPFNAGHSTHTWNINKFKLTSLFGPRAVFGFKYFDL
jgi:hypothetical protein